MLWMLLNIYTENGCCYWAHNSVAGWSTLNSIRTIFPLPLSYFITFVCNHYLLSSFNMYVCLKLLWQQFQATFHIIGVKIFDDEYCWMLCYTNNANKNLCSQYWYTHNLVMIDIDWGVRVLHISLNDEQVNQICSISQPWQRSPTTPA